MRQYYNNETNKTLGTKVINEHSHTNKRQGCRDIVSIWLLTVEWCSGSDLSGWNVSWLLHSRSCWASPVNFHLLFLFHHLLLLLKDSLTVSRTHTKVLHCVRPVNQPQKDQMWPVFNKRDFKSLGPQVLIWIRCRQELSVEPCFCSDSVIAFSMFYCATLQVRQYLRVASRQLLESEV